VSRWKLRIEERAEGEAREAFFWYRARNPAAAELFQAAVEECIDRIAAEPETFPVFEGDTRRRLISHRFPYGVMLPQLLALASVVSIGCAHPVATHPVAAASTVDACAPRAGSTSAFELAVLGSGGPVGSGRAASGYVVFLDGVASALIDVGPGAVVRLGEMGIDLHRLDTVLLTHLHIDHSGDLPGFVKSRDLSYDEQLVFRIFGPGGGRDYPSTTAFVDRLFGAQGAFAYLPKFRNSLALDAVDLPIAADAPIHEILGERASPRGPTCSSTIRLSSILRPHPGRSTISTQHPDGSARSR
jgi:plasmid stabilization system protein ParE